MSREVNFQNPSQKDKEYMAQRPWMLEDMERLQAEPPEEEEIDLAAMTVPELRELCDEYDLDSTGKKSELIDRLMEYLSEDSDNEGTAPEPVEASPV